MSEEAVTSGKVGTFADKATGGSWTDIFGGGLQAIADAGKAVAVAVETQQLSVDPHLVEAMLKKLDTMKDELEKIMEKRAELSMEAKLGGGYAQDVTKTNTDFGKQAIQQILDVNQAIDSLKTQIEKSRASYQNADQSGVASLKKLDGKS
ncbi:hypothetical protein SK854_26655 [Lentzea sp. BCCO 10_0061]|uniref:Uncharacterized protein n=1 Tax=Lentzea sokolovensis TaxID=3095429 RepID=A0ABU4V1Z3_9PSEU|nr:hypothetical protein [Lentzea sp. BCCO 10_0061]MDX8145719.1 hypothetical protein [Lentzea sp. BCCO 10_0061]